MKSKTKLTILFAFIILLCGVFLFLFYTPYGLLLQTRVAPKVQAAYLRFYSSRLSSTAGNYSRHTAAQQLFVMGQLNLWAARDAATMAIAQDPRPFDFYMRARVELDMLYYTNAVADYDAALRSWQQLQLGEFLDPKTLSNHLEMARSCAEAKQKYWEYWKNSSSNPPPASESKPASPPDN
jgi:hypothetical protein